jgi:calcineurin-like phosphoesterase family protein
MNQVYFTSDHHFLHNNVIEYCNRPFSSVEEMNQYMIQKWNEKISETDLVYYLGDFAIEKRDQEKAFINIKKILEQLNGQKILIAGNHDEAYLKIYQKYFVEILNYYELEINKQKLILFHYPIEEWNGKYKNALHLHGHQHGKNSLMKNRLDVGADKHNFIPLSYAEVINEIQKNNLILGEK